MPEKLESLTAETAILLGSLDAQKKEAENAEDEETILNNRFL